MKILRFISKIVKFILREICSFAIKLGLIFVILLFVLTIFLKSQKKEIIKSAYLKIDLSKEYTDPATVIPFNLDAGDINFYTLMTKINMAKVDKEIKGLVLFLDGNSLSRTKVTELIEVLKDFKASNKPIYSYATMLNNNSLLLSSISTEFYMPPSATTTVNITGYYKSLPYYKELADKIGVDFNVIHVGDFKTFGENYVRKEISNENRADLTRILDKSFDIYTDEYSTNANVSETRIRNLIITGELMGVSSLALKDSHLIKNLDYWENVKKDKKIDKIYDIAEYHNLNMVQQKDKIAVVYAVGDIESSLSKEPKFLSITSSKEIGFGQSCITNSSSSLSLTDNAPVPKRANPKLFPHSGQIICNTRRFFSSLFIKIALSSKSCLQLLQQNPENNFFNFSFSIITSIYYTLCLRKSYLWNYINV